MNTGTRRYKTLQALLHYFHQDNTRSGAHCRYNLKYHIVWIPKYRRAVLVGPVATRLKQMLTEIAAHYGFRIVAQEVMPDHVHMLVETAPKHAPAYVVNIFKGITARKLRLEFPDHIKKFIWKKSVVWASGYYIATVADKATTEMVQEYIETQNEERKSAMIPFRQQQSRNESPNQLRLEMVGGV